MAWWLYGVGDCMAVLVLNDPGLSQATLALKIALTRNPALLIAIAWAVLICTITVVIRVSESTAGVETSPYVWDQIWLVIVSATVRLLPVGPCSPLSLTLACRRTHAPSSI